MACDLVAFRDVYDMEPRFASLKFVERGVIKGSSKKCYSPPPPPQVSASLPSLRDLAIDCHPNKRCPAFRDSYDTIQKNDKMNAVAKLSPRTRLSRSTTEIRMQASMTRPPRPSAAHHSNNPRNSTTTLAPASPSSQSYTSYYQHRTTQTGPSNSQQLNSLHIHRALFGTNKFFKHKSNTLEPRSILKNSSQRLGSSSETEEELLDETLVLPSLALVSPHSTSPSSTSLSSSSPLWSGTQEHPIHRRPSISSSVTSDAITENGNVIGDTEKDRPGSLQHDLREFYKRATKSVHRTSPEATLTSHRQHDILRRCSYKLSPRLSRRQEPQAEKRVTFYLQ